MESPSAELDVPNKSLTQSGETKADTAQKIDEKDAMAAAAEEHKKVEIQPI